MPSSPQSKYALIRLAMNHPVAMTRVMVLSALVVVLLALAPTLAPKTFPFLQPLTIDTDPENMLDHDEPVRVFHDQMKERFDQKDIVLVAVANDGHKNGVFNPASLARVHALAEFVQGLQWPDPITGEMKGVVGVDVLAPSTVDNIEQAGLGAVSFSWLMATPPTTEEEALAVRDKAKNLPLLDNTIVSADGTTLSLYLPLTAKDLSYRTRNAILEFTEGWEAKGDQVYITGLPVAEDTFGVEMFIQMAISAPLAMLLIFCLLWYFFRSISLITSPMIVAMVVSLTTMGALVATGNTVHIMSSMIPIFIMPIAVLDAVHILSEFFDRYQKSKDRQETIVHVMDGLYKPMLFTTLTTAVGFASLALTPIPPVQVFGVFVALGVVLAWFWTIVFIPAFIQMMKEERFTNFGLAIEESENGSFAHVVRGLGNFAIFRRKLVVVLTVGITALSAWGISKIVINDNPIKWFEEEHPIREADRLLNDRFGGGYLAYLAFEQNAAALPTVAEQQFAVGRRAESLLSGLAADGYGGTQEVGQSLSQILSEASKAAKLEDFWSKVSADVQTALDRAGDGSYGAWDEVALFLDRERQAGEVFKSPETLHYLEGLQAELEAMQVVGKTSSVADIVKTVHRELFLGDAEAYRVPDSPAAVAQTLITYQNSHRPQDLWKFVTPDYSSASLWVQLKSGDNRDMSRVVEMVDAYVAENPLPQGLEQRWYGLTYINVVWQEKMVSGMLEAFISSFAVVLVMMILLFRSFWWGLLSMVPLSLSVALIYGLIGIVGKDYDMPVAVLSALSLGLAVDYAIHFIARTREAIAKKGEVIAALQWVFGEPARAIVRNAIVLGIGFTPLLLAPLIPYNTVGILIAAILLTAGLVTLVLLPSLIVFMHPLLFRRR